MQFHDFAGRPVAIPTVGCAVATIPFQAGPACYGNRRVFEVTTGGPDDIPWDTRPGDMFDHALQAPARGWVPIELLRLDARTAAHYLARWQRLLRAGDEVWT